MFSEIFLEFYKKDRYASEGLQKVSIFYFFACFRCFFFSCLNSRKLSKSFGPGYISESVTIGSVIG